MKKELKVQRFQVWRDNKTKEITDRRKVSTHLISEEDVRRMNKQNFGNSISGSTEYFFEVIPEPVKAEKPKEPDAVTDNTAEEPEAPKTKRSPKRKG